MKDLRVALVQMESIVGQREKNIEKIASFTQQAGKESADIICFPEMSVHGYCLEEAYLYAEEEKGKSSGILSELAVKHGITILAGMAERAEKDKDDNKQKKDTPIDEKERERTCIYISQFVFHPCGKIEKYRKTHLGKKEKIYISEGSELKVFNHSKARTGIEICQECHYPEISTTMALKGAEVIFAPHASPLLAQRRREVWSRYMPARAYDNSVYFLCCNMIGESGRGGQFGGGIMAVDPKGRIIAQDFTGKEGMLIVDLKSAPLNSLREEKSHSMKERFYLNSRRPELYGF